MSKKLVIAIAAIIFTVVSWCVIFISTQSSPERDAIKSYEYQIEKAEGDLVMFPERSSSIMKSMDDVDESIKREYDKEDDMDRRSDLIRLHYRIESIKTTCLIDSVASRYSKITSLR